MSEPESKRYKVKPGRSGTDPEAVKIGKRLRSLRSARNLSLTDMTEQSGLAIGTISQIERGLYPPSERAASVLMASLGLPVDWLFETPGDARDDGIVRRSGMGRKIHFEKNIVKELLNPDLGSGLELLLVTIGPYGTSGDDQYTHRGEEGGYVIKGELELVVGERCLLLKAGDSFAFKSTLPHRFRNPCGEESVVVWAITPPLYQGHEPAEGDSPADVARL